MNKNPIGRPPIVFDEEKIKMVEEFASVLTKQQICDYFKLSWNAFDNVMERQPEVEEAYLSGKAKAIASVANSLLNQALNGNVSAAIFYLKTRAGWTESSKFELTGANGAPVAFSKIERVVIDAQAKVDD